MIFKKASAATLFLSFILLFSSCISRLSRPQISGVIVDYNKNPVGNFKVGEAVTTADGAFSLKEIRYNKFLLSEIMIMEAPPLRVYEKMEKEGYVTDAISLFNPYGGGETKGAKYKIDTVYVRKVDQQLDASSLLLKGDWELGISKNADTVYMVRAGFSEWCKTDNCGLAYRRYQQLTDDYMNSSGPKNLPEGVIRRSVTLQFGKEHTLNGKQTTDYKSSFDGPNKKSDTLQTTGTWQLQKERFQLQVKNMPLISKKYQIADLDIYQMMLVEIK